MVINASNWEASFERWPCFLTCRCLPFSEQGLLKAPGLLPSYARKTRLPRSSQRCQLRASVAQSPRAGAATTAPCWVFCSSAPPGAAVKLAKESAGSPGRNTGLIHLHELSRNRVLKSIWGRPGALIFFSNLIALSGIPIYGFTSLYVHH